MFTHVCKNIQSHDDTQDTNTFEIFPVPIGNSKCVENFKFHNDAPMLKCSKNFLNICCFNTLASDFASIEQTKATNDIPLCI